MQLKELVTRYRERAGGYNRPLHLSEFGLAKEKLEQEFSAYEEDYQIGRFLKFSRLPDEENHPRPGGERLYTINGYEYSHVTILVDIESIL